MQLRQTVFQAMRRLSPFKRGRRHNQVAVARGPVALGKRDPAVALFSATIAVGASAGMFTVFHASIAATPEEIVARLIARLGEGAIRHAVVDRGFDATERYADILVSPKMRALLVQLQKDPASPLARGFELNVEQSLGG